MYKCAKYEIRSIIVKLFYLKNKINDIIYNIKCQNYQNVIYVCDICVLNHSGPYYCKDCNENMCFYQYKIHSILKRYKHHRF